MVESRRAPGRSEAVQLGRLLQASGYVHHVVDDHDFKDEFLYFRFYCGELSVSCSSPRACSCTWRASHRHCATFCLPFDNAC